MTNVRVFVGEGLWETNGISVLIKETPEGSLASLPCEAQGEDPVCELGSGPTQSLNLLAPSTS